MHQTNKTPGRGEPAEGSKELSHVAQGLVSQNSAPVKYGWPDWWDKYNQELVSVIPANADSETIAGHLRGKCPGTRKADGKWVGTTGAMADRLMTLDEAKTAHRSGAVIGMLGRNFPALDIDVEDEALADAIEKRAFDTLGPAPVRVRAGSSRRLLMYAGSGLQKRRLEFRTPDGCKHAVELLATGQYFNVDGIHPSGSPYEWQGEHPCVLGPYGLSETDADGVSMLFEALPAALGRHGCTIGREATAGASGSRKRIDDAYMAAPSPQHVLDLLAATPCIEERFKDRHDIVAWLCGVKAALGDHHEEHRPAVLEWFLEYPGAEEAYFDKIWDSVTDSAVGWDWLAAASGTDIAAQVDFANPPEIADEDLPEAPEGEAQKAARKRMFSNTVYISGVDRFGDWETGDLRDAKALCVLPSRKSGRAAPSRPTTSFSITPVHEWSTRSRIGRVRRRSWMRR
jgi:hypothetical protein